MCTEKILGVELTFASSLTGLLSHPGWNICKTLDHSHSDTTPLFTGHGENFQGEKLSIFIIIIIIIKRGWQCKAWRERLTPYQSEDPNPTTPTHRKKEEKGKTVEDKKWASS